MKTSAMITGASLTILAMLGGFNFLRGGNSSDPGSHERPGATLAGTAAKAAHEWKWLTNGEATYELEHTLNLETGDAESAPDSPAQTVITGRLHVRLLEAKPDRISLAMQMSGVRVEVRDDAKGARRRDGALEAVLDSTPGLLHLGADGRLLGSELPAAVGGMQRALLDGLFGIEFVLKAGPEWQTREMKQGLACECTYRAESDGRFSKTRRTADARPGRPATRMVQSEFHAVPGSFWLQSLSGAETMECVWENKVICKAAMSMRLTRIADGPAPNGIELLAADAGARAGFVASDDLQSMDDSRRDAAHEQQRMAKLTEHFRNVPLARMMDDLVKAVATGPDHAATIPAMHALRDWLLVHPERAAEVAATLQNRALNTGVTARAVFAGPVQTGINL